MPSSEQFFKSGLDTDAIDYIMLRHFSLTYSELKSMKMSKVLRLIRMLRDEEKQVKWDV